MKPLSERKKAREHIAKVNRGEIVDLVITNGTNEDGDPVDKEGRPINVPTPAAQPAPVGTDVSTLTTHAALDEALNGRAAPEGWAGMKVAEKQEWLKANPVVNTWG